MSKSLRQVKEASMAQSFQNYANNALKGKPTKLIGGLTVNVYTGHKL
jgi:hypothetical protein